MLKVDTKRENVDLSGFGCLVLCVTSQTPPTGDGRKLRPLSFGLFISLSLSLFVWRSECFYFLRNDLNEKKNLKFLFIEKTVAPSIDWSARFRFYQLIHRPNAVISAFDWLFLITTFRHLFFKNLKLCN